MRIPLVNLKSPTREEQKKIYRSISTVIKRANFVLGKDIELFEKHFAAYCDTKYCVGVGSGSDAILLSLKALEIGKGDEVIIPAMTFMSTASSIIYTGATPVFVDILPNVPLIDPAKIEAKITKRTKAIIPVHMHGYPCDMDVINRIAKKHKLFVIEDACQAHGSTYKKKLAGSLGDLAAFSFYPTKNLGAYGDAGAITTSNKKLYEKLMILRHHGQKEKNIHDILGYNSRLDTLQAVILDAKLPHLDNNNTKRRKHAALYTNLLKNLPIQFLIEPKDVQTNYYVFGINVEKRDELAKFLKQKNIETGIYYPLALHLQPALIHMKHKSGDFPNAEYFGQTTLSLPMFPELTEKEIHYICKQIKLFYD